MDVYINLFLVAVSLAGFIAVFLIFQYTKIDTYVDNRKSVLRKMLETEAERNSTIYLFIQDIGKKPKVDYLKFFSRFKKAGVTKFVNDILKFRKRRKYSVRMGLISIISWASLAMAFLIFSCLIQKEIIKDCSGILWGSIGGFAASLIFTLVFICLSTKGNWPE
ncbi:MAG: hypothetical protein U9Q76_10805 [candidate division WOR-3 bacterium]|nr:hypothetical protein [candidate division WOR-3 bacterium]